MRQELTNFRAVFVVNAGTSPGFLCSTGKLGLGKRESTYIRLKVIVIAERTILDGRATRAGVADGCTSICGLGNRNAGRSIQALRRSPVPAGASPTSFGEPSRWTDEFTVESPN